MPGILQVSNVTKEYPAPAAPLCVLRGVSLELSPGQSLAVVGPSGSGKSTLLNILGTLERPTSGSVMLDGVDPFALSSTDLAHFRARQVGFVFQDHHLLPQCTALENVLVPLLADGRALHDQVRLAEALLDRVGLASRRTHFPSELSGGERQRVAIARALVRGPALLLADEPTGNLDAETAKGIIALLASILAERKAMLIAATHSAALARSLGEARTMNAGRLEALS